MNTVLIVSPSLGIGGRERIALNTVQAFEELGYHVILVVFQRRDAEYPFEGELVNLNIPAGGNVIGRILGQVRRSFRLCQLRKKYRARLVYSLGEAANIANVLSGLAGAGKTVVSIHGFGEVQKGLLHRLMFSRADRVVCIARDMRHCLLSLYPGLENVAVVENGYRLRRIAPREHRRAPFPRLVSMGRLTGVKGFERLLRSVKKIRDSAPGATLVLIGAGKSEAALRQLASDLGLRDAVDFMGYQADPLPIVRENDIYVLTSLQEGFPNALIEALHCGLPAVAVDCRTGPREILSAEYTPEPVRGIRFAEYGVLVEESAEGFEDRFAEAVLRLWKDSEAMQRYREIGPDRAGEFSLERYRERLKRLLDD